MSTTVGSTGPSREVTAAVVRRQGSFEIGQARLEAPRDDEILVRIVAAGLCHTDLVVRDQLYPVPLPIVLGHEGAGVADATLDIGANRFMQSCKTIMGVVEGNSVPDVFVPQLLDLHMQGCFPFDRLLKFYDFDQINEAAADTESGATVKPILRMS